MHYIYIYITLAIFAIHKVIMLPLTNQLLLMAYVLIGLTEGE